MPRDTTKTEAAIESAKKGVLDTLKKSKGKALKRGEIVAELSSKHKGGHVETAIRALADTGAVKGEQRGNGPKAPYFYSI